MVPGSMYVDNCGFEGVEIDLAAKPGSCFRVRA
jgi:hypothetical protein